MRRDIVTSLIGMIVLTLLLGIAYPLIVTGVSQVAFPGNANGQKVYVHGQLIGSKIIGQNFAVQAIGKNRKPEVDKSGNPVTNPDPRYFQPRPSATVPPNNAAASTFSNLGPNSKATLTELQTNIQAYIGLNGKYYPGGLTAATVPVDAANSSASGLDPDISVRDADVQAYRVATVRAIPLPTVMGLVSKYTHGRGIGFSGEPGVNVLELNLALDQLKA
jgi:K+-transporting ATPase ATPase C chain